MTLQNAYATLADFMALPEINSAAPADDLFIEDCLNRASRAIDDYCGTWFYAAALTRLFDTPQGRCLELDAPLLAVTTLINGNGTPLTATDYALWPNNGVHKREIRLLGSASAVWELSAAGDRDGAISVAGTWGYVDRAATDPESRRVIVNTTDACLVIALAAYRKRYGQGLESVATVTGAGVVISPRGLPLEAKQLLTPYVGLL